MNYPQTFAKEVAQNIQAIGNYGCLAMCYLYSVGIDGDSENYIRAVSQSMDYSKKLPAPQKFIDEECTILNASAYLEYHTGKRFEVIKHNYTSIEQIKNPTPVRFEYLNPENNKKYSHWVVVENGKIVFNSLINSSCISRGKLAQDSKNPNARIIRLAK